MREGAGAKWDEGVLVDAGVTSAANTGIPLKISENDMNNAIPSCLFMKSCAV